MLLKRIYDRSSGKPVLDHIKVLRAGDKQHFSTRFIATGQTIGYVSVADGMITLTTKPKLVYNIIRAPGYYCCHCDAPMSDGAEARGHLEVEHKGKKSPDPSNPAGYRKDNFYACERVR